jgi:L-threonylcarbamoyladenylate synthase
VNEVPNITTRCQAVDDASLEEASRLIRAGQPVAVPTETVYGLAADATEGEAVARIYEAKGRPAFNPLIIHVPDLEAALKVALFDDLALSLAGRFWPGPLTLVLPRSEGCEISTLATAGLPTIALRVPAHPAMQALLRACGRPLAAPSANPSGRISPTRAEHVQAGLGGRVALILNAGPTTHGLESTIIGITDGKARLLRPGPIDPASLGIALEAPARTIEAPGQLAGHYAPGKPLRLEAVSAQDGEWLIGFGATAGNATLSQSGDLVEAAAALFDRLHEADAQPSTAIAVAPIPDQGLGIAINDRLRRAASSNS